MDFEQAKEAAYAKAIEEGYDQLIFLNKKRKYDIKRATKAGKTRPSKLVCYVRLFYKDHTLIPRVMDI